MTVWHTTPKNAFVLPFPLWIVLMVATLEQINQDKSDQQWTCLFSTFKLSQPKLLHHHLFHAARTQKKWTKKKHWPPSWHSPNWMHLMLFCCGEVSNPSTWTHGTVLWTQRNIPDNVAFKQLASPLYFLDRGPREARRVHTSLHLPSQSPSHLSLSLYPSLTFCRKLRPHGQKKHVCHLLVPRKAKIPSSHNLWQHQPNASPFNSQEATCKDAGRNHISLPPTRNDDVQLTVLQHRQTHYC